MNRLWTRLGDASENEEWGQDLAAVAGFLLEFQIKPYEMHQVRNGFVCPGFEQRNYVALYWGDQEANCVADLDRDEFEELQREMARATQADPLPT